MGTAKNHRQSFLQAHPHCVFCGGNAVATTIEHCPPRAMFQNRHWPEGFEFPACSPCNNGTNDHDLLVAMLARMDPFEENGNKDGKLEGIMKMANKQYPGLFSKMFVSPGEARRNNRKLGIQPQPGQTHQEAGGIRLTSEVHEAVCVLAKKLAKGIFYRETQTIFPDNGCLLLNWFTNAELIREGKYVVFDLLKELGGSAPPLQRSNKYLNDQFEYKITLSPEMNIMILQARFGNSFGLVVFGSTLPDRLEAMISRLREQSSREGPFAVLQSTSLMK